MSRHATALQKSRGTPQHPDTPLDLSTPARSPVAESLSAELTSVYSGLIARLFTGVDRPKVIAFVSTLKGEGVTYTINRVSAEIERGWGLRIVTVTASEIVAPTSAVAPHILGTPTIAAFDPPEILPSLVSRYDVVFIDAGSVAGNVNAIGAVRRASAVVIVVEAGKTRRERLNAAVSAIRAAHGQVVGYVLNKYKPVLPAWMERMMS